MTQRGLADTSVFIAREPGRPLDLDALPDEVAVSIITVGELRAGVPIITQDQDFPVLDGLSVIQV